MLLLAGGLLGTGTELLLLEHTEDLLQLIPLGLIGLSLLALLWERIAGSTASLLVFRGLMLLSVASGAVGVWLHYRGNVEFEIESVPGLEGFALFRDAMSGATPALAPGTMILLGALGLLATMGRPRAGDTTPSTEEP
jgi:hypothetical protein